MKRIGLTMSCALALLIIFIFGILAAPPPLQKPAWAGADKKEKKGRAWDRDRGPARAPDRSGTAVATYFGDRHRVVIRDYYAGQFQAGRCPPGLAKKRNGCMPPGQAKKWVIGRPLPGSVIFYDLPQAIIVKLGPPPPDHRFVRVAADVLLITIGTGMVIDAIENLGRM